MEKSLARCIGLWLAEGDTETHFEITFTNNCFELVELFYDTLENYSSRDNFRLYVYRPSAETSYKELPKADVKLYLDERASKPYYILRQASVDLIERWKEDVSRAKSDSSLYKYILQGFFAGEGSVYQGARNSRRIRIAQGKRMEFLERILDYFSVDYHFRYENRSYVITKKENFDKLSGLEVANLHPRKREKFRRIYSSFQEEHYPRGYLKENILSELDSPCSNRFLSRKFSRSKARIYDVLVELKEEEKAEYYRVGSRDYWVRKDREAIIISETKRQYIDLLDDRNLKVGKIADHFSVSKNSAYKNLYRLEELGLIKKQNHEWETIETDKEVIVL